MLCLSSPAPLTITLLYTRRFKKKCTIWLFILLIHENKKVLILFIAPITIHFSSPGWETLHYTISLTLADSLYLSPLHIHSHPLRCISPFFIPLTRGNIFLVLFQQPSSRFLASCSGSQSMFSLSHFLSGFYLFILAI